MNANVAGAHQRRSVSLVVPALNEADNVPRLMERLRHLHDTYPHHDFELVLVDDGSTDGTADVVESLVEPEDRVVVVRLARSFGSHYAITAGLTQCTGDSAIVMGADLQEPVSMIEAMLQRWDEGAEVVWGIRASRTGRSRVSEWASSLFSWAFARYAGLANYPAEGPSGVLIDRAVIDAVGRLGEGNRNVYALIAWVGFDQQRIYYDQDPRVVGSSHWTKRKMLALAIDSFVQFSSTPLRVSSTAGMTIAGLGVIYALVLVVRWIAGVDTPTGWPTVIVLVLVLGGVQLFMIGVMGEYMWRGVAETRRRPLYVMRDIVVHVPQSRASESDPGETGRYEDA